MASIMKNSSSTPAQQSPGDDGLEGRTGRSDNPLRLSETLAALPVGFRWAGGILAVALVLVVCLAIWGPEMDFPTTVSRSYIPTDSGNLIEVDRDLRKVTGDAINAGVKWLTVEVDWLFDGIATPISYSLNYIEDGLKWIPWPALVLGVTLLAFVMGRWSLAIFAGIALLFIGFMDLWDPAIETIALMVVAAAICMLIGLPLGVLGARSRAVDNLMRPILDGMQTMPSFVYPVARRALLWPGPPRWDFRHADLRCAARNSPDQPGHSPGIGRDGGSRPVLWGLAQSGARQGADSHGPPHDHGRHQPDDHDGSGHGDHCQHGCRRWIG